MNDFKNFVSQIIVSGTKENTTKGKIMMYESIAKQMCIYLTIKNPKTFKLKYSLDKNDIPGEIQGVHNPSLLKMVIRADYEV